MLPGLGFAKVSRDDTGDQCEADDDDGSPTIGIALAVLTTPVLTTPVPATAHLFALTTSCHRFAV
jgi:hypothetical protein